MRKFSNPILNVLMYCSIFCLLSVGAMALTFKPILLQPSANETCVPKAEKFIWQQEQAITDYRLQIASDAEFATKIYDDANSNTFADVVLPAFNTKYWWRVIVRYQNTNFDTSYVYSFRTKFDAPSNLAPLDLNSCELSNVLFTWTAPALATKFRLQVSDSLNFATTVKDTLVTSANILQWQAPKNIHTYFWRIRTEQTTDCGSEWSLVYRFTTTDPAPTVISPAINQLGVENSTVKLVWNKISPIPPVSYGLRVSKSADMSNSIINQVNYADTSYVVSNLDLNTNYYWQVNALIQNGCNSDWSAIRKFTTKYATVNTLLPLNAASCLPKVVRLSWNSISTARAYNVQISNNPNFPDTISTVPTVKDTTIALNGVSDTTALVTLPQGLTTYYWRVKASDTKNKGDWSNYKEFTTTYSSPVLISPLNNADGGDLKVVFKWERKYVAEEYIFQLATNSNFMDTSKILVDTLRTDSIAITLPRYNAEYYWRVAVLNSSNCLGMWSPVNKIRTKLPAPVLLTPINKATKQDADLVLEWKSVVDANLYDIQVATDSTFKEQNIAFSLYQINGTKVRVPDLNYSTKYFWHVRAKNNVSTSNWSAFFQFSTSVRGADVPELVYPNDLQTKIALDTTLIWKPSARAISYTLEIAKDKEFTSTFVSRSNILTTSYKLSGLTNYTSYYWRVAAVNDSGVSKWSEIRTFRTIASIPTIGPKLLFPTQDSVNLEKYVPLRWTSVETCDLYQVQVSTTANFATADLVLDDANVYKTNKDFTSTTFKTKYYWRVLGINEAGQSPWSEVRNFTIKDNSTSVEDINTFLIAKWQNQEIHVIVIFKTNEPVKSNKTISLSGCLKKYANPDLIEQETEIAWSNIKDN